MIDKEKVINELENTAGYFRYLQSVGFFGDQPVFREHEAHCNDAITMLKEQEAVEPRLDANCLRIFRCGACGEYVGFIDSDQWDPNEQDNYCRNCGRKVKWDGNYKAMR